MILLIELNDLQLAQMLADYLQGQQISCQIHSSETGVALWLLDENQAGLAETEIQRFIHEPYHPRYREAAWQQEKSVSWRAAADTHLMSELVLQAQPLMLVVTGLVLIEYLLRSMGLPVESWLSFEWPWLNGQIWRLFTPVFLHFSVIHLLFNLSWWWYLGGRTEQRYGVSKLAIVLISGALIPNVLQAMVSGNTFGGLSGVTYALLGYLWLRERHTEQAQMTVSNGLFIFMLCWLTLGFADVLPVNTANFAHLGGLLVGLVQGWRDSRRATPRSS
jgi:Uncharacterized membrane protein (homolog of Drosophila rhomboid)